MQAVDREYYRKREAEERTAANSSDAKARRAHLELADLYAARLRAEPEPAVLTDN